jgi:hypothetical protein
VDIFGQALCSLLLLLCEMRLGEDRTTKGRKPVFYFEFLLCLSTKHLFFVCVSVYTFIHKVFFLFNDIRLWLWDSLPN